MSTLALIGLGSNLGDRRAILDAAVAAMAETPGVEVRAVSSYHETAPVGGPSGQGPFLNAAAAIETSLTAEVLHARLIDIECEAGRVRLVRWGERTLDLDLLLFGDEILDKPTLILPHPRMAFRRFVLAPAFEVAPEARDPLSGRTIASLLATIDRRPGYVAIHGGVDHAGSGLLLALSSALGAEAVPIPTLRMGRLSESPRRGAAFARCLERMVSDLADAGRAAGTGWVVSDFWLDGFYHWAIPRLEPQGVIERFREQFAWARLVAPMPTMVVRPRSQGPARPRWADRLASLDPSGESASILHLESEAEPGAVAEVVAACSASRSGLGNA